MTFSNPISIEHGAWLRFFIALVGLALAFAAALFSTVTRESGNLLATAVLASLALMLAGIVAVTTVPYLARRVAVPRVRDALDYDVTREGLIYSVFVLVIGVAALNTGNNLLFIVVSAMLAAIVVSGVASAGVLRGLELDVSVPAHVFAGSTAIARLTLHNRRRRAPSFSVSVVPPRAKTAGKRWRWERSSSACRSALRPSGSGSACRICNCGPGAGQVRRPLSSVHRFIFPILRRGQPPPPTWNCASPAADAISRRASASLPASRSLFW